MSRRAIVNEAEQRVLFAAQNWAKSRPWQKHNRTQTPEERELYEAIFLLGKARHITGETRLEPAEPDTEID